MLMQNKEARALLVDREKVLKIICQFTLLGDLTDGSALGFITYFFWKVMNSKAAMAQPVGGKSIAWQCTKEACRPGKAQDPRGDRSEDDTLSGMYNAAMRHCNKHIGQEGGARAA